MLVSSAWAIRLSLHPVAGLRHVRLQQNAGSRQQMPARLPLRINSSTRTGSSLLSLTTYFLTATSLLATNHLHRSIAMAVIQTVPSKAMT